MSLISSQAEVENKMYLTLLQTLREKSGGAMMLGKLSARVVGGPVDCDYSIARAC